MPTTVTIEPTNSTEYVIHLADGAAPAGALADSQTYYPDRNLVVGYTSWWTVTVAVDGAVVAVDAAGAEVTVDGETAGGGYGEGGYGAGGYGSA